MKIVIRTHASTESPSKSQNHTHLHTDRPGTKHQMSSHSQKIMRNMISSESEHDRQLGIPRGYGRCEVKLVWGLQHVEWAHTRAKVPYLQPYSHPRTANMPVLHTFGRSGFFVNMICDLRDHVNMISLLRGQWWFIRYICTSTGQRASRGA